VVGYNIWSHDSRKQALDIGLPHVFWKRIGLTAGRWNSLAAHLFGVDFYLGFGILFMLRQYPKSVEECLQDWYLSVAATMMRRLL